jgi:hypothetical protein
MGVEDVATRKPQNYSNVQLVKKINDSAYQDGPLLKKSEENEDLDRESFLNEVYKKDINAIKSVGILEAYWRDSLIDNFNITKFWGYNKLNKINKLNILIIHEPPNRNDFNQYLFLDGKKRNLINNIIFSILSGESEREVQNIFVPILPIPLNKAMEFKNLQSFHLMFLKRLKHIIKPSLTILIGDKAISLISPNLRLNKEASMKEDQYFSIPELEYMMSVPEVKKTVWEEWKQKRRTLKNELFL